MSRQLIVFLLLAFCVVLGVTTGTNSPVTHSPEPAAIVPQPQVPADELVGRVAEMSSRSLKNLAFRELHFLKHAVLAATGHDYSEDRPWLKSYFHASLPSPELPECKKGDSLGTCRITPVCVKGCKDMNLSEFAFTPVKGTSSPRATPESITALARIRQAIFSKLRALSSPTELATTLDREKGALKPLVLQKELGGVTTGVIGSISVLGRVLVDSEKFDETLLRDLMGDLTALALIEQINTDNFQFDEAELLGLGLGDVDLLRKAILARAGKTFEEPLKTELAELGIRSQATPFSELSPAAKEAMDRLNEVVQRMARSELDETPRTLRAKALDADNISLSYSGTL